MALFPCSSVASRRSLRLLAVIALLAAPLLTSARAAHAQNADSVDSAALLERELAVRASDGRRMRIVHAVAGVILAGVALPAGIVLQHREEQLVRLTGVGLIVGGSVQLVPALRGLFPSDMESLYARFQERKAKNLSPEQLVAETEKDWREEAEQEHKIRTISGFIHFGLGLALLPAGLTLIFKQHVGDWSSLKQLNVGSALLGVGMSFTAIGLDLAFTKGDSQRSWEEHASATRRVARIPRFSAGPVAHGAVLMASGKF